MAAGIYDLQGNPWAYSSGFAVTNARVCRPRRFFLLQPTCCVCLLRVQAQVNEIAAVSSHFAEPSGLAAMGATIAGVRYMFVRGEENHEIHVKQETEGVVFYRCNTCIIVAHHDANIEPDSCSATVAMIGDSLKESGI